jgi:precorrin-6B methylase 2
MKHSRRYVAVIVLVLLSLCFLAARSQQQQQFQPTVGQSGKDVIWVPTPPELVTAMLAMAKVTPNDLVMDLGSGDGRIVIAAAKLGATAIGVEFEQSMVDLSRGNAKMEGVTDKATFIQGDIFETDFSKATVITMYLLPNLNMKLREKILDMKPGTRVVSHAFTMEDWESDQTQTVEGRTAYFWIVPAKVNGAWTLQAGSSAGELSLQQTFQKITGSLKIDGKVLELKNASLEGASISFSAGDQTYSGAVNANSITGTVKDSTGRAAKWTATRRPAM